MRAPLLLPCLLLLLAAGSGCVERRLLVRSDPPGAVIYVDGEPAGRTPAEGALVVPFEHYGTRTLTARLEGHVPVRRDVTLDPPWYQYFPLDLVADLLWPGTIEDDHAPAPLVLAPRPAPGAPEALAEDARHFAESEERRP